ncbi:hypothetical protein ACM46_13700 [Chryseobacterium angstadtii]|uniref:Uncharacterized protein n=1 Tax=Chryseobacterium angstadtii TaxID=558151 RepID=A0A0J7L188_9FLAO|nr:hypothetical protein [Chryseobacterium angstadtii]KMQ63000.1 hypothetical protein ACM46_13700 [Chryseobacterium angstadtii]
MSIPLNTIYSYFETGDFPTQDQFQASWSSFWHKDEVIPTTKIAGLENLLQNKADKNIFELHVSNPDAHADHLAKKDASNLTAGNVQSWKEALGVGELPGNIATVDNGDQTGNVYTKKQSDTRYMIWDDFVNEDEKILAEKIEALGLTTLIESKETTIAGFAGNSGGYQFEDNDFIAVPDNNGNFSLYMFKGGEKKNVQNYLPTGISNVTIGMVEGLQAALNGKMDKPSVSGNYIASVLDGMVNWKAINISANSLVQWNGTNFSAANMYNSPGGNIGIATKSPSELLQIAGRVKTEALVFDVNSETRRNQMTYDGSKFWGTSLESAKRPFMYADYDGELELWSSMTEQQRTRIKTVMNGGWTTNAMSVGLVYPPVIPKATNPGNITFITLIGSNLNVNPASFTVAIVNADGDAVEIIDNSKVTLLNANMLNFSFNSQNYALGYYRVRIWNGAAEYTTPMNFTVIATGSASEIDISDNRWSRVTIGDQPFNKELVNTFGELNIGHDKDLYNYAGQNYNAVLVAYYMKSYLKATDDFVIEGAVSKVGRNFNPFGGSTGFGITTSQSNSLSAEKISGAMAVANNGPLYALFVTGGSGAVNLGDGDSMRFIIAKRANYVTTSIFKDDGTVGISANIIDNSQPTPIRFKVFATAFQYTELATFGVKVTSIKKI